jgi:hypothetical protein
MAADLDYAEGKVKRAGVWPFVVLAAGVAVVAVTHRLAVY